MDSSETESNEQKEYFLNSTENYITDLLKAVSLNRYYGNKLGWNRFYDQINNLLLPYSGLYNITLGEEAFAKAVSEWQKKQGFSEKDSDGIIGPNTWNSMKAFINLNVNSDKPEYTAISSVLPSIEDIPAFNSWHAKKILDSMNAGIAGSNFGAKEQLESIADGVFGLVDNS